MRFLHYAALVLFAAACLAMGYWLVLAVQRFAIAMHAGVPT